MPRRFGVLVVGRVRRMAGRRGVRRVREHDAGERPCVRLSTEAGSGPTNGDGAVSADGAGASSDATTPPLDGMPGDSALSDATPEQTDANGSDASDANSVTEDSGGCTSTTALFGGNVRRSSARRRSARARSQVRRLRATSRRLRLSLPSAVDSRRSSRRQATPAAGTRSSGSGTPEERGPLRLRSVGAPTPSAPRRSPPWGARCRPSI